MRIDIAVYTAQEGYSWQPGTALCAQELREYKNCIGRFPSPDSGEFPIGGIFLKEDKVVFYRYHVAKRIDFRGRDALYCVLGVLPKSEVSHVDPKALFALPEFAGVVRPFPTRADIVAAVPGNVPEWLKNLDTMSLDVRIAGTPGNMKFAVEQKPMKMPTLPMASQPVPIPPVQPPALESVKVQPSPSTGAAISRPFTPPHALPREAKSWWRSPYVGMAVGIAIIAIMIIVAIVLVYFMKRPTPPTRNPSHVPRHPEGELCWDGHGNIGSNVRSNQWYSVLPEWYEDLKDIFQSFFKGELLDVSAHASNPQGQK